MVKEFGAKDKAVFSRLLKRGYCPQIIFDVGASNGWWSKLMHDVLPKAEYHLFEPLADETEYATLLSGNLDQYSSFKLHKYALGEQKQEIVINAFPQLAGSTALEIEAQPGVRQIPVQMLSIDDAINELQLPTPQVIKIDTQGCEFSILKGAKNTLPKVDILLLECWLYRGYGKNTPLYLEIANWLLEFDFYLWDVADEYRTEEGILTTLDFAFINANSGIAPSWFY